MTAHLRTPARALISPGWSERLMIAVLVAAILSLRALGMLPPDATFPMAPWFLDAMTVGVDWMGR